MLLDSLSARTRRKERASILTFFESLRIGTFATSCGTPLSSPLSISAPASSLLILNPKQGSNVWEKWILHRLTNAVRLCNEGFKTYDFSQSTTAIYNFWLYELCDVYLESMKPSMKDESNIAQQESLRQTLYTCLDYGLRLLQPFMPFISEELYQRLPRRSSENYESICIAPFPKEVPEWQNEEVDKLVKFSQDIIRVTRSLRASFNLTKEKPKVSINLVDSDLMKNLAEYKEVIAFLGQASEVEFILNSQPPEGCAVDIVNETCQVYMMIKGLVDIKLEIEKLEKKKATTQGHYDRLFKTTQNAQYHKVPENLKAENTKKLEGFTQELDLASKMIENYKKFD